jgi:hypothetical protein
LTLTALNGIVVMGLLDIGVVPATLSDHGCVLVVMHSVAPVEPPLEAPAVIEPKSYSGVTCEQVPADPNASDDATVACIDCVCVAVTAWPAGAVQSQSAIAPARRIGTTAKRRAA